MHIVQTLHRTHIKLCYAFFFLLAIASLPAHSVDISSEQNSYNLNSHLRWFEDKSQLMTINDITQKNSLHRFQDNQSQTFNKGFSESSIWLQTNIKYGLNKNNSQNIKNNWYLSIDYPLLDDIEIYRFENNQLTDKIIMGDKLPFSQRPIQQRAFIYPLNLDAGQSIQLFIKITSTSALKVPVYILNDTSLSEKYSQNNTAYGMYFGVIIAVFLYNLIKYLSSRERFFAYNFCYIISFGFMHATLNGHSFQYLWPHLPEINTPFIVAFFGVCCFFGCLTSLRFLSYNGRKISLSITLKLNAILAFLLVIASPYILYSTAIEAMLMLTILTSLVVISSCVNSLNNKDYAAITFLLAWLCIIPSVIIYSLMSSNYLPVTYFSEHSILIGSALQIILLSFSLENRINEKLKQQKYNLNTEHKKLLNTFHQQSQQLATIEQSLHLKNNFLATVSHELRTPINGIEGSLSLVNTKSLDQQQLNYVYAAIDSSKKLTSLIDSILYFSEIESGSTKIKNESFEVRPIFNKLAESYRSQLRIKDITLNWHIDKEVPNYIVGDSHQLRLVLSQILDNAIQHTDIGSITVTILIDSNNFILSVSDTGHGMSKAKIDTIFQEVHQQNADFLRHRSGLGIGLSICHRLSLLMGGKLTVESTVGEGSHFSYSIPLNVPKNLQALNQAQLPDSTVEKIVLVAEDNPVNQMVMKGMLEKMGCIVLTANNGKLAIDVLKQQPVDLILMDCEMPIMNGFEATQQIRHASAAYTSIPIIAVTANAMSGDDKRCIEEGMNDYMKKPVNKDILQQKITHWLREKPPTSLAL